ncbi:MAG: hypothetical protein M1132_06130 [Chloroflexi bacterium]|nr:hypothetical protein [Chloroflexota bacterium]
MRKLTDTFVLRGRAWVFGDQLDADWQICSLETMAQLKSPGGGFLTGKLGKVCLENVDPEFSRCVQPGDFIVAGENMGYSASCLDCEMEDPHAMGAASLAIKEAGVGAVLCESSNANFMMTSLNLGLPVVECRGLRDKVHQGDHLQVNLAAGTIVNLTTGDEMRFPLYPESLLERIAVGGLYPHLKHKVANEMSGEEQ